MISDQNLLWEVYEYKNRAFAKSQAGEHAVLAKLPLDFWFQRWFKTERPAEIPKDYKQKLHLRFTFLVKVRELREMAFALVAPDKLKQTLYDCIGYSPRLVLDTLWTGQIDSPLETSC